MLLNYMHPADQLVTVMSRIYKAGMTTTSGGNLSILDPDGSMWITPGGVDKGSLHRSDIVRLMPDGQIIGCHPPSSEFLFHQAIYRTRPDVKAILHAHSPALLTFCMMHELPDINLTPNAHIVCGKIAMAPYARMGSSDLAEVMAQAFASGQTTVLMENHGVCIAAESMTKAYRVFETLEFSAQTELLARHLGAVKPLSEDQIDLARTSAHTRLSDYSPRQRSSRELELRTEITGLIRRAVDQGLFNCSQGTISARVNENTFLITPFGLDRHEITPDRLVLVKKGFKEAGKVPSRAVFLHEMIYHRQNEVQAIIAAQPPHITAYSITDCEFDPQMMPEPYVMLHKLPRALYGLNYQQPKQTADLLVPGLAGIMLDHDGILMTGKSLTQAFDRLEVTEFAAAAALSLPPGAVLYPLSPVQIKDLDQHFVLT